jgi:hypothetical protein
MQQCETSTETVKRVSVRTAGAGHAHSGVTKEPGTKNGSIARTESTVLQSSGNIVVRLGT